MRLVILPQFSTDRFNLSNVVILSRRDRVCHLTCRRWFSSQLDIYFYQVFAHILWKAHSFAPILLCLFSLSLNLFLIKFSTVHPFLSLSTWSLDSERSSTVRGKFAGVANRSCTRLFWQWVSVSLACGAVWTRRRRGESQ